jgi:hypothetical protein
VLSGRVALAVAVVAAIVLTGGCGGASTPTGPADQYPTYTKLARQLGGKVLSRADAAARAGINCGQNGPTIWKRSSLSLRNSPTDLALVRAYCPDRERALTK